MKIITKLVLFSCLLVFNQNAFGQKQENLFTYFFKSRPVVTTSLVATKSWDFKPTVQVPAFVLYESKQPNTLLEMHILKRAGAGITLQYSSVVNEKNYAHFSWSPALILLGAEVDKTPIYDIAYCTAVGFFNNRFQIGCGYDFGTVTDRSRFFGLLSLGINITNN